jgi:hypothetical protein
MSIRVELNAEIEANSSRKLASKAYLWKKWRSVFCRKLWLLALCLKGI